MNFKILKLVSVALLLNVFSYSQELAMDYYSYLYNPYNLNPAYTVSDNYIVAMLNTRQRAGLESNNTMFGVTGMLGRKQGFGLKAISDIRGAFQVIKTDITYGYNLTINDNQSIVFGMSMGIISKHFNVSRIKNFEELEDYDPVLETSNLKSVLFTSGLGFLYKFNDLTVGVSAPHLAEGTSRTYNNIFTQVGYSIPINKEIIVQPEVFYFNMPIVKNIVGFQTKFEYKNLIWTKLGYQTNSNMNLAIGCNYMDIGFGYGYEYANNQLKSHTKGTHEVLLILNIGGSRKRAPRLVKVK